MSKSTLPNACSKSRNKKTELPGSMLLNKYQFWFSRASEDDLVLRESCWSSCNILFLISYEYVLLYRIHSNTLLMSCYTNNRIKFCTSVVSLDLWTSMTVTFLEHCGKNTIRHINVYNVTQRLAQNFINVFNVSTGIWVIKLSYCYCFSENLLHLILFRAWK